MKRWWQKSFLDILILVARVVVFRFTHFQLRVALIIFYQHTFTLTISIYFIQSKHLFVRLAPLKLFGYVKEIFFIFSKHYRVFSIELNSLLCNIQCVSWSFKSILAYCSKIPIIIHIVIQKASKLFISCRITGQK